MTSSDDRPGTARAPDRDHPPAPERTAATTDTMVSTVTARWLTARWPTALALVQVAACMAVIVLVGADVEFAPGPAVMAGIYLVAFAVGRPAAAWAAWPSLMAVVLVLIVLGVDLQVGMTVVLVVLWIWAIWRGRARDRFWFTLETAGMVVFGAFTLLVVVVDPTLGGVLAGLGWIGHGFWDIYHFVKNKVVNRPWSEFCAVVDIPVGVALVVATLVQ